MEHKDEFKYDEKICYTMEGIEKEQYFFSPKNTNIQDFSKCLSGNIRELKKKGKKAGILFVCIGTDRSTGDSLGPLLGYKLENIKVKEIKVLGTLDNPIHAVNMQENMRMIREKFSNWIIVAVDASIGKASHIGMVSISQEPLKPGLGVGKDLSEIGDISITGVATDSCRAENLMGVRLSIIMCMVDFISSGIKRMAYCTHI